MSPAELDAAIRLLLKEHGGRLVLGSPWDDGTGRAQLRRRVDGASANDFVIMNGDTYVECVVGALRAMKERRDEAVREKRERLAELETELETINRLLKEPTDDAC